MKELRRKQRRTKEKNEELRSKRRGDKTATKRGRGKEEEDGKDKYRNKLGTKVSDKKTGRLSRGE